MLEWMSRWRDGWVGLRRTTGNRVWANTPTRVRISFSPPQNPPWKRWVSCLILAAKIKNNLTFLLFYDNIIVQKILWGCLHCYRSKRKTPEWPFRGFLCPYVKRLFIIFFWLVIYNHINQLAHNMPSQSSQNGHNKRYEDVLHRYHFLFG